MVTGLEARPITETSHEANSAELPLLLDGRGAVDYTTLVQRLQQPPRTIRRHLRELLLMGGNGASLRFDAVAQRGSRDNDYLTSAAPDDIDRAMDRLGERFAALGEMMQPRRYRPKRPVRELSLNTYIVPVPLLLDHGNATNNQVKVEFHFHRPPKTRQRPREPVAQAETIAPARSVD